MKNLWEAVLADLRKSVDSETYQRWFSATAYASDSGDQITVWVPTEPMRRHIESHYKRQISRALAAAGRPGVHVRFVVAGVSEDEEDDDL